VDVALYKDGDKKYPLYTVSGQWNETLSFHEGDAAAEVESVDVSSLKSTPMIVEPLDKQDPWESRKAWAGVIDALNKGDMQKTVDEKSKVEQAQRQLRKLEESKGEEWEGLFFNRTAEDAIFARLAKDVEEELHVEKTRGVWKFDHEKWKGGVDKPFHGDLRPGDG